MQTRESERIGHQCGDPGWIEQIGHCQGVQIHLHGIAATGLLIVFLFAGGDPQVQSK